MAHFYWAAFIADFALGAVLVAVPFFLIERFDASSALLGLIGALGALFYSAGVVMTGRLSDSANKKKVLATGCLIFIITVILLPNVGTLSGFIIAYPFISIGMCMFWPVLQSWLSQGLDKKALNSSLSSFNTAWSAGLMAGYLASGFLFELGDLWPFAAGAAGVFAAMVPLMNKHVISERHDESAREVFIKSESDRHEKIGVFLIVARMANFTSWFVSASIRTLFPRLGYELSYSAPFISALLFLMLAAQTGMFLILGRTSRWHYRLLPIILPQLAALAALGFIAFTSNPALFGVAMAAAGISSGISYSSSLFYGLYGFIDKGKNSGIHEAVLGAGTLFGPLLCGIAAYRFGVRSPYVVMMAALFTAVVAELIVFKAGSAKAVANGEKNRRQR